MRLLNGVPADPTPADIAQRAIDAQYVPPRPRRLVPLAVVLNRLTLTRKLDAVLTVLDAAPEARARLLAAQEGIYADDADAIALLTAAGADPAIILG